MAATPKPRSPSPSTRTMLSPEDFERYLLAHAAIIAPSDVTTLVGRSDEVRRRLIGERAIHPSLAERAGRALALLGDHATGACPQIPYYTVSLLAAALLYYLAPMDVIPDFIPRAGTADDALVLDIAWRLAAPGVQRYVDWKELASEDVAAAAARPRSRARRGASRSATTRTRRR
jgi:uncharacterized membrane protein YkvA (DUF1232 family)